jgi:hypothetical protein
MSKGVYGHTNLAIRFSATLNTFLYGLQDIGRIIPHAALLADSGRNIFNLHITAFDFAVQGDTFLEDGTTTILTGFILPKAHEILPASSPSRFHKI